MRLRITILLCMTLTAMSAGVGDAEESRLRIDVFPRVSAAPAAVRIRAIVIPDVENRALQIVVESGSYYRSSLVPLDGANAAAITETTLKNIPGGEYEVTVALVDVTGRPRTMDRREVTVSSRYVN
jgi:hypothetical protein